MQIRRLTRDGLLTAIALTIFMVEAQIPALVPIPGIKLGLSNIVTVFTVFAIGPWEGAGVLFVRVFLGAVFSGNLRSILYSAAGAVVSFVFMVLLKKTGKFSYTAVSVAGGVMHNLGQIGMACVVMGTDVLKYYAPFLVLSGTLAGIVIGLLAAIMVKRIDVKY